MEPIEIKVKRIGLEKEHGSASNRLPGPAIIMVLTLIVFGNWIAIAMAPMGGGGGGGSGFGGILLNQGFEELTLGQPDNWTLGGTAFVTNSSSSEGNNSLFINASENGEIIFANQTLDVYDVSGMNFTFIVNMTRSGGTAGDAISFYLNYVDINATPQSQWLMTTSLSDTSGSIWNKYIVNLTVPDDTFNISGFEIRTNGTGEYWIDDLKLIMDYKYQYWDLYQNYSMVIKEIDVDGELLWLATEKDHIEVDDSVVANQTTYDYINATSDLILNGTVNYIKPYNNNKTYLIQITDVWQFSDTNGSMLINGTYNTFLRGDQYHDPKVMPSGSAVLDINEFTGDVFSFDMGEVENELMMVKGDGALRFAQTPLISGNLVDMGTTPIDDIIVAPDGGYVNGSITPLIGNSYCVNNSGKYGKFEVADVTSDNILIHWSYQPNGSRYFMHGDFKPPVLTPVGTVNVNESESLLITLDATDPNSGDTLIYSTNATFGTLTGNNFTWTPNLIDVGIYYVDFGVSDGVLFNNTTATIIVSDSNPPVVTILSPQNQIYNTDTVALNYTISEPTTAVWYSLDGGANVSISGNTTLVSLTPNWHNLYIFANDTSDNLNFSNVSFYINAPPNLVPVGTVYGNETEQLNITLSATDPNGDSLTFSTNASYGTLVGNNYTWTPNSGEAGIYYVDFGVSDGVLVNNTTATIVIQDNNQPVISGIVEVNITTHTATIEWNTDEVSYSEVSFGTESGNYTDSVSDTTLVTSHRIDLYELMWSTTYYYRVTSTDQAGNANQSIEYNFTTPYNYEIPVSSIENDTNYVNATNNTDTNVEFVANQNVSGNISITLSSNISELVNVTNPLNNTNGLVSGDTPVEKYFQVNVSGNLSSENVSWAIFKLYYTIADLDQNGDGDANDAGIDFDESKTTIYWYNESGDWIKLTKDLNLTAYGGPYVHDTGVNTTDTDVYAGYAWVNKSGFSTFALVSSPIVEIDEKTTSSGGGGGGGGGSSGEAFENILIQENDRQSVFKDNDVAYSFDMDGNIVRYVNFTSLTSSGTIVSKVEILNHTSTMVDIPAPDSVFKNLNIWLGNLGWASEKNIRDVTITFEVNRSWIQENNIDPDTVTLSRYTNDTGTPTWLPLQTTLVAEEDEFLVYMSITTPDGFGNFVVVGVEIGSQPQATPTPVVTSTGNSFGTPVIEPTPASTDGSNSTWLIVGFIILLLVVGVGYMERDLITKWLNERRP